MKGTGKGQKRHAQRQGPVRDGMTLVSRRRALRILALGLGAGLLPPPARALGDSASGPDSKIRAGLKEALKLATSKAVQLTGRRDGFFLNRAIQIPMPERFRSLESGLRKIGYGDQCDAFVLSMNRAAERAAPGAKPIFLDAIAGMTIDDARKILGGGDHAATDFFRARTTDQLTVAFKPIVSQSMGEVGVTRRYEELVGRFQQLPFAQVESLDLDQYVTAKGLNGLFHVLAEQEAQIRVNPAARATDLLKEVFGH